MGARVMGGPPARVPQGLHVYTLRAPLSTEVRYVGVTYSPRTRWHMHVSNAIQAQRKGESLDGLFGWILSLRADGQRPVMELVGFASTRARGAEAEERTIRRFIAEGAPLFNLCSAGRPVPHTCSVCGAEGHNRATHDRPDARRTKVPRESAIRAPRRPRGVSPARCAVLAIRAARA